MIGIVLLTHGGLGHSFIEAAEKVVGSQQQIEAIAIESEDNLDKRHEELSQAINRVNTGEGVILLTDMFGGLTSHLAMSFLNMRRVEVISGVNLPMLVKLLSKRRQLPLAECAQAGQQAGIKYINIATQLLEPQAKAGAV